MKSLLPSLIILFSYSFAASAGTIVLAPGESGYVGATQVVCSTVPSQPTPTGPICKLISEGKFERFNYNHRVAIDNVVVFGSDHIEKVIESIESYRKVGLCSASPAGVCKLAGPGQFGRFRYDYRISIDDENIVFGSDNQTVFLAIFQKLRQAGLCK